MFWKVFWTRMAGWFALAAPMILLVHELLERERSWPRVAGSVVLLVVAIRGYAWALRTVRSSEGVRA